MRTLLDFSFFLTITPHLWTVTGFCHFSLLIYSSFHIPRSESYKGRNYRLVQALSSVQLFVTLGWQHTSLPCNHQLQETTQTHVRWGSDAIQPCHPLLSASPRAFNLSQHQDLFHESVLHIRWPKYWSFSFSPSNEYSGLISFRMDWLDLLAVQGTFKSLLQHHSSKASILLCSAFFIVQLSHPYMTTGKTIALTRQTFVDKVTFLLFNRLSRLVIAFLLRSKCLLISWLQSSSTVIWSPPK